MYRDYIDNITKIAGYSPVREKNPVVSKLLCDAYVKEALVAKLLNEGAIDENLAKILLTKSLITKYI